jgi:hypothetical protein
LAEEFEDQIVFFGVTKNDTVEAGREYVRRFSVPYSNANAPEVWAMFDDPFRPTTLVLDGAGREVARVTGPITYDGLRHTLEEVLATGST